MHHSLRDPLVKRPRPKNKIFVNKKFVNEGSITKFTKKLCHENLELYGIGVKAWEQIQGPGNEARGLRTRWECDGNEARGLGT